MPAALPPFWGKAYGDKMNAFYDGVKNHTKIPIQANEIWRDFIDSSAQGLTVLPPFISSATTTPAAFNVTFPPPPIALAPIIAAALGNAWFSWYMAITWSTPAPIPPFSAITAVTSNPATAAAAMAALIAGLTAEFLLVPPPDPISLALKNLAIGTLFYTATVAGGVLVTGISLTAPPAPLIVPLVAL